jgi:hypothetical protein
MATHSNIDKLFNQAQSIEASGKLEDDFAGRL